MKRYAETFFRYWLVALAPIVVLSLIGYATIRSSPKTAQATAKLWIDPSASDLSSSYNQYQTPAQNEQDVLTQLLQISSFDWVVARGSTLYMQVLSKYSSPGDHLAADLQKNVQFTPGGNNLLYVSYTYANKNLQLGVQVIQSVLSATLNQTHLLNQQQAASSINYYKQQLQLAQQHLRQSAQAFAKYVAAHGIASTELTAQMTVDPTLAGLYTQVQADQASASNIQQRITALQLQSTGSSEAVQSGIHVADPPSVIIVSSKKKELMNLAIYVVIGLLLGGGFVVVKTLMDRSLRYADEVPEMLGLRVLAVLPYSPDNSAFASQRGKVGRPAGKAGSSKRLGVG